MLKEKLKIRNCDMLRYVFFKSFNLSKLLNRNDRKRNCGFVCFCFMNHLTKVPIQKLDLMSKNS